MRLYEEKRDCCGCSACADVCPVGAIRMVQDEEGFFYPEVEESLCINCRRCEQVCPVKNPKEPEGENLYFGVQAKDPALRGASSSGGMFPVLAEYVLERGGAVYGAAFDGQMEVVHREVRDRKELDSIKRTKYVQSSLQGVYQKIASQVREGRWVLFVGTPCQAQALKLYLGREYDTLIVAALICYGVPSPGVWSSYVKYLERRYKGRMTSFSFRDKRNGDSGHTCAYVIDGREYAGSLYRDLYCRMYFGNEIIRPSCHACRFCTTQRDSDFTIGDFWGIEKVRPDLDDGMGNSVVIVHSRKAREVWEKVKGDLNWFSCDREDVLQPRLSEPTGVSENRKIFWLGYRVFPFSVFKVLYETFQAAGELAGRIMGKK